MATFAPSAARRLAIAAPIPREPPVTSAIFPSNFFDIVVLLELDICLSGMIPNFSARPTHAKVTPSDAFDNLTSHLERYFVSWRAMLSKHVGERWNYDTCVI